MPPACPTPKRVRFEEWPGLHPTAAGIDIGARELVVAVPTDRDAAAVRALATCTPDLHALVDWLLQGGIDTVARASTGISWVPIFEVLELRGITPDLVTARQVMTGPGSKSDGNDAQWLQKLHTLGLVQDSLRPDAEMWILRTLLRHRAQLIEHRAPISSRCSKRSS
jgi:transposase